MAPKPKVQKLSAKTANAYLSKLQKDNKQLSDFASGLKKDFVGTVKARFSLTDWQTQLLDKIPKDQKAALIKDVENAAKAATTKHPVRLYIERLPDGTGAGAPPVTEIKVDVGSECSINDKGEKECKVYCRCSWD